MCGITLLLIPIDHCSSLEKKMEGTIDLSEFVDELESLERQRKIDQQKEIEEMQKRGVSCLAISTRLNTLYSC